MVFKRKEARKIRFHASFAGVIQFMSWVVSLILGVLGGVGLVNLINPEADLAIVNIFEMIKDMKIYLCIVQFVNIKVVMNLKESTGKFVRVLENYLQMNFKILLIHLFLFIWIYA